jgi:hypothetical protein
MGTAQVSSIVETPDLLLLSTVAGQSQCYRVKDGNIEFRPRSLAQWRRLHPTDVLQHLKLQTVVADWLRRRLHNPSSCQWMHRLFGAHQL